MQDIESDYSDLGWELNTTNGYPEYGFVNDEVEEEWKINQEIIKNNG